MENQKTAPAHDSLPEVVEMELVPVSEWGPTEEPVHYRGPSPIRIRLDRFCKCGVRYANEITVPKRHSVICVCPRCGCVTVD